MEELTLHVSETPPGRLREGHSLRDLPSDSASPPGFFWDTVAKVPSQGGPLTVCTLLGGRAVSRSTHIVPSVL